MHKNARLTPKGREVLIQRLQAGQRVAEVAQAMGLSETTVRKWWRRFRHGEGLANHSSRPRHSPRAVTGDQRAQIEALRRQRRSGRWIAMTMGLSAATVSRVLRRAHLSRWRELEPQPPVVRYERAAAGELTGYGLSQYVALAQLDYNSGRPQAQAFDVGWQQFQNKDAANFLKFNGGLALGGAAGGVASVSPLFNAALTGYALSSGANEMSQGHYISGGLQMVGGGLGLGLLGQQSKEAATFGEWVWSPLGGTTATGAAGASIYDSVLWRSANKEQLFDTNNVGGPVSGLGNSTTSPWLADPRAGVRYLLENFRQGGSFIVTQSAYEKYMLGAPYIGRIDGQFMTSSRAMDNLLKAANGDVNFIKQKLGIPVDQWNEPLLRIDVPNPLLYNARLPSGFENGANSKFRWGGFTSGGQPEVVTDPIPSSEVRVTPIPFKKP